jgi:hypothetical protein
MRRAISLLFLLVPLLAHAADQVCTNVCQTDRQSCRDLAQRNTEFDTMPGLDTPAKPNPNAAVTDVQSRYETQRPTAAQEFRKRRAERLDVCEAKARQCAANCKAK